MLTDGDHIDLMNQLINEAVAAEEPASKAEEPAAAELPAAETATEAEPTESPQSAPSAGRVILYAVGAVVALALVGGGAFALGRRGPKS